MSKRTKFLLGIGVIAALVIGWQVAAFAVHDTGKFELDGNATNAAATPGDDWDNVCREVAVRDGTNVNCTTTNSTNGATAREWVAEPNLDSTIFTGGGSKDPQDISNWKWKDGAGGLPAKDNLLHSFAARYTTAQNEEVLFFGSDRWDNSGDATQGFWFFQNPIARNTPNASSGTFSGLHKNGDLLVLTDFSNGGGTSTINVYEWDTRCTSAGVLDPDGPGGAPPLGTCGDTNLMTLASSNAANCASAAAGDDFCGIVNAGTITMPWSFQDKSLTPNNQALNGEFFEGGINLTALGLGDRCFSTVASESRASTSTNATLKDFVVGGFGSCGSSVTTTPKDNAGANIPGTGLSINGGSVQVKDSATVAVSGTTTWAGSVKFFLCGPPTLQANETCTTSEGGTEITPAKSVSNTTPTVLSDPATVTSAGRYCWRAEFTSTTTGVPPASDASATECFTVNPVTPTLATTAGDDVTLGNPVTDTATLSGTANKPGTPVINPTTAGGPATGTITFTLYKADCSTLATGTGTNPQTVNVSGNGTYPTGGGSVSFTPNEPGTYHWVAEYSGDLPNTLGTSHNKTIGTTQGCTDANETVVVNQQNSTVNSTQDWLPNDTATLNHGGPSGYTVKFTLFKNGSVTDSQHCSVGTGTQIYTADRPVSGSGTAQDPFTASTNNTTKVTEVTSGDKYTWKIEVPETGAFKAVTSCEEATTFTSLDNGDGETSP